MPAVFLNFSNHRFETWPEAQKAAADSLAPTMVDMGFPQIPPEATLAEVGDIVNRTLALVPGDAYAALVVGEWTATVLLVMGLQRRGIRCVAATSARHVVQVSPDHKESRYRFVQFRDYPDLGHGG